MASKVDLIKRFKELQSEIDALEKAIEVNAARKADLEKQIKDLDEQISELRGDLKAALVKGNQAKVKTLEDQIRDFEFTEKTRFELLSQGLDEKEQGLEIDLVDARKRQNEVFAELIRGLLTKEVKLFDKAAGELILRRKRLLGFQQLLRQVGMGNVYRETIGPVFEYMPAWKIPVCKDFSKTKYLTESQNQVTYDLLKKLRQEIMDG